MPRLRSALVLLLVVAPSAIATAQDGEDFATEGGAWNSVSGLVQIAAERGLNLEVVERLDAGTLTPNDSVLILHPEHALPGSAVTEFLRAGGRVALADDFGEGDSLLRVFRIARQPANPDTAMRLRGNPELLVGRSVATHRLTRGVRALVTNHPQIVFHRELSPLVELSQGEAIVLAGAVGEGRLVVISDSSVFIDNMLALRGNRRFTENLLDYLEDGRGGRIFLVGPDAEVVGRYGEPGADRALHDLRAALERLSGVDIPPIALQIGTLALALIALVLVLGALPQRSPYRTERMFARAPAHGGFVGRVGFFAQRKGNLLHPLLVYKFELEAAIIGALALEGRALLRDVLDAMRSRGSSERDIEAMRTLLLELDELRSAADRPPAPPKVGAKRFSDMVARGEALLARLDSHEVSA